MNSTDLTGLLAAKIREVDCFMESLADMVAYFGPRQQVIELYCLAQGIHDNATLLTPGHVVLDFLA